MKKKPLKLIGDLIMIKRDDADEKTPSGLIWIPGPAQEQPLRGTVVAVGPGKVYDNGRRHDMDIKVGDKIYFTKNYTKPCTHNGEDYLIMDENRTLLIEL